MTLTQIDLLQRLIAADRDYHSRRRAGEVVHGDDRGVEVGSINGVSRRTAKTLVNAGLAESVATGRNSSSWLFLGKYEPFDPVE